MLILITAASTSGAYALKNKLGSDNILLGDYEELPDFMLKSSKMLRLPDPAESSYTHQILSLCLDNHIDTIYALRHNEAELLLNSSQLFAEYGISIFTDDKIQ